MLKGAKQFWKKIREYGAGYYDDHTYLKMKLSASLKSISFVPIWQFTHEYETKAIGEKHKKIMKDLQTIWCDFQMTNMWKRIFLRNYL